MRPTRRLLGLALAVLGVSALALAIGGPARAAAPWLWAIVILGILADLALSVRGRVGIAARLPASVFVGESTALELAVTGRPSRAPRARFAWPAGLSGPEEIDLAEAAGGGWTATCQVHARQRGTWAVERLWLSWQSRLDLIEFTPRVTLALSIAAEPNIRPVTSGAIDVAVRSALFGVKENFARGDGSEFHQLRDFTTGMDTRAIDWKRSARHRHLVAKETRAERNHHVIIALDNGHLMREEVEGLAKIDHAVNAGLAVAWAAAVGGDLVGLYAYDAQPRLFEAPTPGRAAFARLRRRTAALEYRSVETNHTLAMAHLNGRVQRRSLIVVFSDFVDPTTAELLVENLGVLARRHVMIFVAIRDPGLARMAAAVPASLDDVAESVSAAAMLAERRQVLERLTRIGVVVLDVAAAEVTARLVSTYLDLKGREVI